MEKLVPKVEFSDDGLLTYPDGTMSTSNIYTLLNYAIQDNKDGRPEDFSKFLYWLKIFGVPASVFRTSNLKDELKTIEIKPMAV